jgi:SAM-dependent methyltransferase
MQMPIIQTNKPLKPRPKNDFYPTPLPFAIAALSGLPATFQPHDVLDPGCGLGVWGDAIHRMKWRPPDNVVGVEIDEPGMKSHLHGLYNLVSFTDFLTWPSLPSLHFDLVCGNPPYRHAEQFVRKSLSLLMADGWLVFLMKASFLESQKRMGLWRSFSPYKITICANRPSFTSNGKTDADMYCFMYWQKDWQGETKLEWVVVEQ